MRLWEKNRAPQQVCGGRGWSLRNPAFEGRTEEQQQEWEEDIRAFSITEAGAFQGMTTSFGSGVSMSLRRLRV